MTVINGWTIKDEDGCLSGNYFEPTEFAVKSRVVGTHYSPAGLSDNVAYRAEFEKDVAETLELNRWSVVRAVMTLTEATDE
ncbi:MAG: hypothetical protein AAF346_00090 [Pseudomonadota bacterium]